MKELIERLEKATDAWVNAKSAVSYAAGSRSANPDLDPDGRIIEMAIDECREAKEGFDAALAALRARSAQP